LGPLALLAPLADLLAQSVRRAPLAHKERRALPAPRAPKGLSVYRELLARLALPGRPALLVIKVRSVLLDLRGQRAQ
jgi:hypothetical protein